MNKNFLIKKYYYKYIRNRKHFMVIFINITRKKELKTMLCNCYDCNEIDNYFETLSDIGGTLKNNENLDKQLNFLNVLANHERLKIIYILKKKDRCVCELEAILDKSQPSISHHLKKLEENNLIKGWKKGKFTYYRLDSKILKSNLMNLIEKFSSN